MEAATDEKITDSITVSGGPILKTFKGFAIKKYGKKGVSMAAREAFEEFLAKRGINADGSDNAQQAVYLAKLRELQSLGVNPDDVLDRALQEVGSNQIPFPSEVIAPARK